MPRPSRAARTMLGLVFELEPFYAWAAGDDVLGPATRRLAGFRPSLAPDPFEMLVGAITAQQVSLFAAGDPQPHDRALRHAGRRGVVVPDARRARGGDRGGARRLGFSRRKAEYTVGLARADIDLAELAALPDDEVKARLVALRGIGEWTADWFLARHLARPNAWPWGDLALRKAVADLYGGLDVREARERFHPYENLSAHYLLLARTRPVIRTATSEDLPLVRELCPRVQRGDPGRGVARRRHRRGRRAARGGDRRGRRAARRRRRPGRRVARRARGRLPRHPLHRTRGARQRGRGRARSRSSIGVARPWRGGARARGAPVERAGARRVRALGLRAGRVDARGADRRARAPARRRDRRADVRLGARPDRRRRARSSAPSRRCCRGSAARSARR